MTPEERARRWLRFYPRAYRERRGDELVSTLLDKARDDPRVPARELWAIAVHGVSMRVRQSHLGTIVVCATLFGAALGAAGLWLGGSNDYVSTSTLLPAQIHSTGRWTPALTAELRTESAHFAAFRRTPAARTMLLRGLVAPYPTCLTSVSSVGNVGVELQCRASSAHAAQQAMGNASHVFGLMLEEEKTATVVASMTAESSGVARLRSEVASLHQDLASVNRSSPHHVAWERQLSGASTALTHEEQGARRLAEELFGGAIMSRVSGPPLSEHHAASDTPVAFGAAAGFLVGLVFGLATRRSHRRPGPAPA